MNEVMVLLNPKILGNQSSYADQLNEQSIEEPGERNI